MFVTEFEHNYHIRVFPQSFLNYSKSKLTNASKGRYICSHYVYSLGLQTTVSAPASSTSTSEEKSNTGNIVKQICEVEHFIPNNLFKKIRCSESAWRKSEP